VIIHDLDPDELRDLAATIPFEMVCEVLFVGNVEELASQFEGYARNGLEHVVLANITGVVGGMDEIMARGMELPMLKNVLSDL
jgi:phthiodiolone/phenolphthiodiolone dimycocerosates ketoreductase